MRLQKWAKSMDFMEKGVSPTFSMLLVHFWVRKEYIILLLYSLSFSFLCIVI